MGIQRSATRAILVRAMALTLWFGIAVYLSFEKSSTVTQTCFVGEQASNFLVYKLRLFSLNGVEVSLAYNLDGQLTRIALKNSSC